MALSWPAPKDPDEVKDYGLNWAAVLVDDTIASSSWTITVGSGLTIDSSSYDDTSTTVWLSSGTIGGYELLNRVTTAGGRTYDQTVKLRVRSK